MSKWEIFQTDTLKLTLLYFFRAASKMTILHGQSTCRPAHQPHTCAHTHTHTHVRTHTHTHIHTQRHTHTHIHTHTHTHQCSKLRPDTGQFPVKLCMCLDIIKFDQPKCPCKVPCCLASVLPPSDPPSSSLNGPLAKKCAVHRRTIEK